MSNQVYSGGRLREQWDDATRTYTTWNAAGAQTGQRPYTAQENAAADAVRAVEQAEGNRRTIEGQAAQALDGNRTFLAVASPTNAQNAAQVKALTRQVNGLIRLVLDRLDGTD
jgi:hypothetical protein